MWFDDAVETFKRHGEYEESTAKVDHPEKCSGERTVPEVTQLCTLEHEQIPATYKRNKMQH